MNYTRILFGVSSLLTLMAFADLAKADNYLITIDDSNPNAVTFTGTGIDPIVSDSTHRYSQGIVLSDFVMTPTLIPAFSASGTAGLITGVDGAPAYNGTQSGSITGTFADLQLYTGSANFENFATATAGFLGVSTFNFGAYASVLPANGATGFIYAGSGQIFSAAPQIIGSYKVSNAAPEPTTYAMMLGALGMLGFAMRRKVGAVI